jgi:SAM-dependent methyltransferase
MRAMSCPACLGPDTEPAGEKCGYALHRCFGCRAVFVHPLPSVEDASRVYADAYAEPEPLPGVIVESLRALVDGAAAWRREGRWLDAGFGDGSLLDVVASRGWTAFGTEVARPSLARAAARGFTVSDDLGSASFPAGAFDVVSMIEVVEHVPAVEPFLAGAFRLLRPGGLLYVSTPNVRSLNARVLDIDWTVVSPPDHLVLFSAAALRRRLARAGFEVRRVRREGLNPSELRARLRSSGPPPADYHRQDAAIALAESFSRSPLRRAARRAANAVLSATGLGDTLKVWAVRP